MRYLTVPDWIAESVAGKCIHSVKLIASVDLNSLHRLQKATLCHLETTSVEARGYVSYVPKHVVRNG